MNFFKFTYASYNSANFLVILTIFSVIIPQQAISTSSIKKFGKTYIATDEFSKDITSLVIESILKSKCPGTIFFLTIDCEDYFHYIGQELSFWSNPILLINYQKIDFIDKLTASTESIKIWSEFLQSPISPTNNFVFVCDLIKRSTKLALAKQQQQEEQGLGVIGGGATTTAGTKGLNFDYFPVPIIRSIDLILYFDGFSTNKYSQRVLDAQKEILQYAEILMFVNKNRTQQNLSVTPLTSLQPTESSGHDHGGGGGTILAAYSSCQYCRDPNTVTSSSNSKQISYEPLGIWQRNKTTIAKYFKMFNFQSEYSFHNFTFKMGYLNYKPHFSCDLYNSQIFNNDNLESSSSSTTKDNNGKDIICYGIEWEILVKMSSALKFTFQLQNFSLGSNSAGGHGIIYSKQNITGIIGAINNKTLDVGLGGVSVTSFRNKYVDFTKIFYSEAIVFVVEKRREIYILGIWLAFQSKVWPLIILTLISLSFLFKYISNHKISLSYGLQYAISTLLGQPLTHRLLSTSPRHLMKIFLAVWWFMSLIIGILYNTSLITSLITPVTLKEPETIHELIEQGYLFKLGCKQSVVHGILQQQTNIEVEEEEEREEGRNTYDNGFGHDNFYYYKKGRTLMSNKIKNPFKLIRERLISEQTNEGGNHNKIKGTRVSTSEDESTTTKIVYVVEESNVEEIDWEKSYGFSSGKRIIQERLFLTPYSWALKKGAPYKRKFDFTIDQLVSVGLINYWYDKSTQANKQYKQQSTQSRPILNTKFKLHERLGQIKMNLSVLHGAFIFFLIGCLVSIIIFSLEMITKYYIFRLLTLTELIEFGRKLFTCIKLANRRINVAQEIVRASQNTIQIVTPVQINSISSSYSASHCKRKKKYIERKTLKNLIEPAELNEFQHQFLK